VDSFPHSLTRGKIRWFVGYDGGDGKHKKDNLNLETPGTLLTRRSKSAAGPSWPRSSACLRGTSTVLGHLVSRSWSPASPILPPVFIPVTSVVTPEPRSVLRVPTSSLPQERPRVVAQPVASVPLALLSYVSRDSEAPQACYVQEAGRRVAHLLPPISP